jgi:hypothetical protein
MQWHAGELERAIMLHKAAMVQRHQSAASSSLAEHTPTVMVTAVLEIVPLEGSEQTQQAHEAQQERHETLAFVVQGLDEDLFNELMEGMGLERAIKHSAPPSSSRSTTRTLVVSAAVVVGIACVTICLLKRNASRVRLGFRG